MTAVEIAGLVLVVALGVYLLVALLKPEKFQ
jgi:K+-transporting ATPase KdpF subunit